MQNKKRILTYGVLFTFIFVMFTMFFGIDVHAEDVNVTIALSETEANVGDTVAATVNISGESLASYTLNISYTTDYFTCSSDEEGSGIITISGSGPASKTIYLVAKSEGRGSVSTDGYGVYDVNGIQLTIAHAGAAVNIGNEKSTEDKEKKTEDKDKTETTESTETTEDSDEVIKIDGTAINVMAKPKDVKIPEGYSESKLKLDDKKVNAYSSDSNKSLYLVYGANSEGDKGLYLYDTKEKSITKYDTVKSLIDSATELNAKQQETTTIVVNEPAPEKHTPEPIIKKTVSKEDQERLQNERKLKMFLYLMSGLFILMGIVVIILVIRINMLESELDEIEEDEDDDSEIIKRAKIDADEKSKEESKQVISRNKGYAINEDTGEILVEEAADNNAGVKVPPAVDKPDSKIEDAMKKRPFGIDSAFNVVSSEEAPEGENVSREPEPETKEPIVIDEEKLSELRSEEMKRRIAEEAKKQPVPEKKPQKVALPGSINDEEE